MQRQEPSRQADRLEDASYIRDTKQVFESFLTPLSTQCANLLDFFLQQNQPIYITDNPLSLPVNQRHILDSLDRTLPALTVRRRRKRSQPDPRPSQTRMLRIRNVEDTQLLSGRRPRAVVRRAEPGAQPYLLVREPLQLQRVVCVPLEPPVPASARGSADAVGQGLDRVRQDDDDPTDPEDEAEPQRAEGGNSVAADFLDGREVSGLMRAMRRVDRPCFDTAIVRLLSPESVDDF